MIHVKEHKEPHNNIESESFFTPTKLYMPLSQHVGTIGKPTIKVGDIVEEGSLIGFSDAFVSAPIHAPLKGKVTKIDNLRHPSSKRSQGIIIEPISETKNYSLRKNIQDLDKDQILAIIKKSGIIGMGGAAFPTHIKLNPIKPIETLIVNGCECEPYLTCDDRLMIEKPNEIIAGLESIIKVIQPKKIFFAIEDNKPQAIEKVRLNLSALKGKNIELKTLKSIFPQGGEKQLIQTITKIKIPGGKLPFDYGCLVINVATCFAVYNAIYFDKPLTERLVTFAGDALIKPKNIWVKIGTTLKELFDKKILEFKYEPKKIICGGPMMGTAIDGLDYPILKATGGFLFLTQDIAETKEAPCIRCGRCADACPMGLLPLEYGKLAKKEEFDAAMSTFHVGDCMECGLCAWSCPAKIPLTHYAKIIKRYSTKK
jgi:electron transport complex protein RnfC